jgi:hypothetical protein
MEDVRAAAMIALVLSISLAISYTSSVAGLPLSGF